MATINVQTRETGNTVNRELRKKGNVPVALLQKGHPTLCLQASAADLRKAVRNNEDHGRVDMKVAGEKGTRSVIVKEVDSDLLSGQLVHVTFQEVSEQQVMTLELPLIPVGHPEAADGTSATLVQVTSQVRVKGKISAIPDRLEVDVAEMQRGETIHASDLKLPEGVTLVSAGDAVIFGLSQLRQADAESDSGVAAESASE